MKCVYCGHVGSRVVDSRQSEDGSSIRRRRECEKCFRRFTTFEKADTVPLMVIKKDKTSKAIGEMVMESLRKLDEVAYVRFACVYHQFRDLQTFVDELGRLISENQGNADDEVR